MVTVPRRRRLWLLVVLIGLGAALGLGMAVQADREDRPAITPYDPLPRW